MRTSTTAQLENSYEEIINPATEEKQDAIVSAIENITVTVDPPVGGATSDNQTNGSQKTQIVDAGGEVATITGGKLDVNASIDTTGLALAANQLPDGHNVTVDNASLAVTGTFWQATQPVSVASVPSHDVTNAGTFAVQVTSAPSTTVTATDLDIRNLTSTDVVTVTGGAGQTADVKVTLDGESVPVTGTFWQATQPVSATDLDIRNLAKAQDEVYAVLRTDAGVAYDARLVTAQSNSGVDIGDVTINNGAGAAAVNIQDGGNTITVDGSVTATLSAETTKVIGTVNIAGSQTIATTNAGTFAVQQSTYSTATVTSVAGSASSVQLLASTAGRRGAYFYNDSTAIAYLKLGTTASTSSFTVAMAANSFYELPYPCYTGRIDCIWASATGNMRITEIT